jgi:stage II sporulation protein D
MVRVTAILASLSLLAATGAAARLDGRGAVRAQPQPGATFVISGRGWGHGVGMSQYGALGLAREGWTYAQILAHYYQGTQLAEATVRQVRVLLADGRKTLRISSAADFRVRDDSGGRHELPAGAYAFGPGLTVAGERLSGPLLFTAGAEPLELNGKAYRGALEITVLQSRLRAINTVALEAYLAGVVPDEVPPDWPAEALKAQAVVARSYALVSRRSGPFDLYADTRSQVYGGVASEEPATTAAVGETAAQVLMFDGKVAATYFYSTSGGRTADVTDVWDGAQPTPYLVSVPDPADRLSPYHTWGPVTLTEAKVRKAFGLKQERLLDVRTTVNGSGRVKELVAVVEDGERTLSGAQARTRLGLRSTWFKVGVLALTKPLRPTAYGAALKLSGVARGLGAVTLERRALGTTVWEPAGKPTVGKGGAFALSLKAQASAEYRLAAGAARTPPVRALVAPALKLHAPTAPTALRGVARPVLAGAKVAIQRREDTGAWSTVSTAAVDEKGAFEAQLQLEPGTYRARFAPGRGFAVGFSPVLEVVPA